MSCHVAAQVVRQPQIHQRLLAILGDMVSRERAGEIVDRALLRATTQVSAAAATVTCMTSSWQLSAKECKCLKSCKHCLNAALVVAVKCVSVNRPCDHLSLCSVPCWFKLVSRVLFVSRWMFTPNMAADHIVVFTDSCATMFTVSCAMRRC
jgi:hypothetical protein